MRSPVLVFWLEFLSPHVADLLCALVAQGTGVVVVALGRVGEDRLRLGWQAATPDVDVGGIKVIGPESAQGLLDDRSGDVVHVTEGLGGNAVVRPHVERVRGNHCRWGVMLEAVDQRGVRGLLRWFAYTWRFRFAGRRPEFVLAIGAGAVAWMRSTSGLGRHVYPFAYFLPAPVKLTPEKTSANGLPRIAYVGQLIRRKRVDLLLTSYARACKGRATLHIVGKGPEEASLRSLADALHVGGEVTFHGSVSLARAKDFLADADCLVLPSDHDGWGAVASESLLCGVPTIVSNTVGAREVVQCSGAGGVFNAGSIEHLSRLLGKQVDRGRINDADRQLLASWARSCLSGEAGAEYLMAILGANPLDRNVPISPWVARRRPEIGR